MASGEFIRGTIKTIILKLLAQNKKMYGYEITQKVAELSMHEIKLTYGALYPILYKLESEGLLITVTEIVNNRARKYYTLTSEGKKLAKVKVSELQRFTEILQNILTDRSRAKASLKLWGT
jgi:PadR family transcriptional regulator, regulatory protein PadR